MKFCNTELGDRGPPLRVPLRPIKLEMPKNLQVYRSVIEDGYVLFNLAFRCTGNQNPASSIRIYPC
jgi:hypothetical protein